LTLRPNIILIVMDTVRADHLSCYGHHRRTTPNIDDLARHGVLYENAFTAAPWTPPSHASIFTGKYPSHHRTIGKDVRLKKENTSLAEILSRNGYSTLGVTCCQLLGLESGFERGFEKFIELKPPSLLSFMFDRLYCKDYIRHLIYGPDGNTYRATESVKTHLKRRGKKRQPFFLFINYFNSHTPYDPPRPFKKMFYNGFHEPRIHLKEVLLNKIQRTGDKISDDEVDIRRLRWIASGGGGFAFAAKKASISEKEWEIVKSWYDGEIAYLDYQFGTLLDFLHDESIFENTLFIITSDHGESFGEHGLAVHPLCLYESVLHVPLIVSHPHLASGGKPISSLVSTIDIFPTITNLLDLKFDKEIQGRSLYPFEERKIHDYVCAEYGGLHTRGFRGMKSWNIASKIKHILGEVDKGSKCIRTLTHKYILSLEKEELYNIKDDPLEERDILNEDRETADSLRGELERTVDTSYYGPEKFREKQKMLDRLKALGYL